MHERTGLPPLPVIMKVRSGEGQNQYREKIVLCTDLDLPVRYRGLRLLPSQLSPYISALYDTTRSVDRGLPSGLSWPRHTLQYAGEYISQRATRQSPFDRYCESRERYTPGGPSSIH